MLLHALPMVIGYLIEEENDTAKSVEYSCLERKERDLENICCPKKDRLCQGLLAAGTNLTAVSNSRACYCDDACIKLKGFF